MIVVVAAVIAGFGVESAAVSAVDPAVVSFVLHNQKKSSNVRENTNLCSMFCKKNSYKQKRWVYNAPSFPFALAARLAAS